MIVFLDFDGVTHAIDNNISGMSNLFDSNCMTFINQALSKFPAVKVVITSTWRLEYSLDELKYQMGVLGEKVIGATPDIPPIQLSNLKGSREIECRAWLKENNSEELVIAIDDKALMYDTLPVYETQSGVGFCMNDIQQFQQYVQALL